MRILKYSLVILPILLSNGCINKDDYNKTQDSSHIAKAHLTSKKDDEINLSDIKLKINRVKTRINNSWIKDVYTPIDAKVTHDKSQLTEYKITSSRETIIDSAVINDKLITITDNKMLYQHSPNDLSQIIWKYDFRSHIPDDLDHAKISYYKGHIILAVNNIILYIDERNGEVIWTKTLHAPISGSILAHQGILLTITTDNHIYGINANDGVNYWYISAQDNRIIRFQNEYSPILVGSQNNTLAIVQGDNGTIKAIEPQNGNIIWKQESPYLPQIGVINTFKYTPSLDQINDNIIITFHNNMTASLDINTGQYIWKDDFELEEGIVMQGPYIFGLNNTGDIKVIDSSITDGSKVLGSLKTDFSEQNNIVLSSNQLFIFNKNENVLINCDINNIKQCTKSNGINISHTINNILISNKKIYAIGNHKATIIG